MKEVVKLRAGKYRIPVTLIREDNRIFFKFGFNKPLMEEIKQMQGRKWHGYDDPPRQMWSIPDNERNRFQLAFLKGEDPYAPFDLPLIKYQSKRPLYDHQIEMIRHSLTYRCTILACEMGTGKTLVAIEAAEQQPRALTWYVGPKSGVKAVERELDKWGCQIPIRMFTYERLVKVMEEWTHGNPAPCQLIIDESSKVKTPTAKRTKAVMHLAHNVRYEHGDKALIILMSGTPAPKSPVDWWSQCEIACPGFLKEGNIHQFKNRLSIIEERESAAGGVYPHVVSWLDDTLKCAKCSEVESHDNHKTMIGCGAKSEDLKYLWSTDSQSELVINEDYHKFTPSVNEVEYLYERMKGLVLVKMKKDCTDLPDKQFELIHVKPTPDTIRAANLIKKTSRSAIIALTRLRELSDGFQYTEEKIGMDTCPNCHGKGEVSVPVPVEEYDPLGPQVVDGFVEDTVTCDYCGGASEVPKYVRAVDSVSSPKDQVFFDELDMSDDVGRYVVWGGFTGTIDRLVELAHTKGWVTLRIDGRGYCGESPEGESISDDDLLDAMDRSHPRYKEMLQKYPRVCVVGHPQAGGMALTFTASPIALYYSNCFDGTARMQSIDRIHRLGMDNNAGATIKDIIHLSVDQLVLDNLNKKKKLQSLSLGDLEAYME